MAGDTTLAENYAFAGMHYIFDKHSEAVTVIKFSPNEKTRLACCSKDGTLSIHTLSPGPPTLICTLRGHKRAVTGKCSNTMPQKMSFIFGLLLSDFDWSLDGDFVLSASLDQTARLWNAKSGKCLRLVEDRNGSELLCCLFQPANNNLIVTGSIKSQIQTWNVSTGKAIKVTCKKLKHSHTAINQPNCFIPGRSRKDSWCSQSSLI
jgi:WD40 repeat protein